MRFGVRLRVSRLGLGLGLVVGLARVRVTVRVTRLVK